jgi:hypothetical protein
VPSFLAPGIQAGTGLAFSRFVSLDPICVLS